MGLDVGGAMPESDFASLRALKNLAEPKFFGGLLQGTRILEGCLFGANRKPPHPSGSYACRRPLRSGW